MIGRRIVPLLFALLPVLSTGARGDDAIPEPPPFEEWLDGVRAEARAAGISEATLEAALSGLEPDMRVIALDRRQPEFTQSFAEYMTARVSETRIARGLEKMAEHRDLLRRVGERYGVQPRFIAAIWGLETNYGATSGTMSVPRSLATLAWDRRRPDYFRGELLAALRILDERHIAAGEMIGSWAGAMGQSQFMPSSFLEYAQDFDGDGRRNIWSDPGDVFASIAHYLKKYGWNADMTWGRQVLLPEGMSAGSLAPKEPPRTCRRALDAHSERLPLPVWQDMGVRRLNGTALPKRDFLASLVEPAGPGGPAFLTYDNFRAILRYNCSNFYALAVGHIADRLREGE
ncbi:MAG: hypothetical protein Kow00104_02600 [Rhodothalassiaceae bacterium]